MKIVFIALMFSLASSAFAAGWYESGKVTRLHSGHGNGVVYFTTEIQQADTQCERKNLGYTFSDSANNTDRIYSLLMAAYVSKIPVSVYVTDSCLGSRPAVNAVQFKDSGIAF